MFKKAAIQPTADDKKLSELEHELTGMQQGIRNRMRIITASQGVISMLPDCEMRTAEIARKALLQEGLLELCEKYDNKRVEYEKIRTDETRIFVTEKNAVSASAARDVMRESIYSFLLRNFK
jgi:hypothetical protein